MPLNFSNKTFFWVILLAGAFLRFHALDRQSLWDDELSSIQTVSTPIRLALARYQTYETHPPLYFLQLKLWRALSMRSLVKLRANSAAWGCLGLVLAYLAGKQVGGQVLGLLTMAILALSPYHLAYSQELRPYAMAMALALAGWLSLGRRRWGAVAFLWTAVLYTHYWGSFVVLSQALYGYWEAPSKSERKALLWAFLSASAAFALWLPVLVVQMRVSQQAAFWASAFSFANLAKVFLAYSGLVFPMASSVFYLPARTGVLAVLGFVVGAALAMGLRRGPRMAALWLIVGLGIPWLLSYGYPSVFVWYRYPIIMLPAFVILVAAGLLAVKPRPLGIVVVLVCLGSQAGGDWVYFRRFQKANPRTVVACVHRLRRPDTLVVRPFYFAELFNFYDQGTTPVLDQHLLDNPDKRAALAGRRVILLAFDVPSDPVADALLEEYKPVSAQYFPGIAHLGITVYELATSSSPVS